MTITIDPQTEATLRALAEREHLLPDEWVARLIQREAHHEPAADQGEEATLIRRGHLLMVDGEVPPGFDIVKAIGEMREERERKALGL